MLLQYRPKRNLLFSVAKSVFSIISADIISKDILEELQEGTCNTHAGHHLMHVYLYSLQLQWKKKPMQNYMVSG